GTKCAVKFKAGTLLKDGLRSRRHAELNVALRGSDPDQGIKKRVRAHDVPARPMFLNQQGFSETRVEVRLRAADLNADGFFNDPPHAAILFSPHSVAILRETPLQVLRFSDVNQHVLQVVNEVDAGRAGK